MNISPTRSALKRFIDKLGWALLALLAPEVVLWRAWSQYRTARLLQDEINATIMMNVGQAPPPSYALFRIITAIMIWKKMDEAIKRTSSLALKFTKQLFHAKGDGYSNSQDVAGSRGTSNTTKDKDAENTNTVELWTLRQGFFAVMGGFHIEVDWEGAPDQERLEGDVNVFTDGRTLTPTGLKFLFRQRVRAHLRSFDENKIKDKSKSDSLAKFLICVQAMWMLIQTIVRQVAGLPVTLLEVNTLAHVVAALLIYAVWWYKPHNANEPETIEVASELAVVMSSSFLRLRRRFAIEGRELDEVIAAAEMRKARLIVARLQERDPRDPLAREARVYARWPQDSWQERPRFLRLLSDEDQADENYLSLVEGSRAEVNGEPWSVRYWGDEKTKQELIKQAVKGKSSGVLLLPGQALKGSNLICVTGPMLLTEDEVRKIYMMSRHYDYNGFLKPYMDDPQRWERLGQCLAPSAPNMLIPGNLDASIHRGFLMLAILGILYGGLHAAAWNSHFPSEIERTLWRICCCMISGGGFGVWLVVYFSNKETNPLFFGFYLLLCVFPVMYVFSRIYIVLESFISVRSLPVGAYDTVEWSTAFPHIG
jgi:hypothetical protein